MRVKERWKRIWPWVALGIVVLALVLAVVSALLPRADSDPEPSPSQAPSTAPTSTESSGTCDMPESDSSAVPDDLRWEAAAGVTWPVSDSLGPTSSENGLPTCFARSPIGAALAATSMVYSQASVPSATAMEFYLVDAPGRDAALADAAGEESFAENLQRAGLTLAGFDVVEYTNARATVDLVFASPDASTGYGAITVILEWTGDDWRLRPLDDGTVAGPGNPQRAGQFISWSGTP